MENETEGWRSEKGMITEADNLCKNYDELYNKYITLRSLYESQSKKYTFCFYIIIILSMLCVFLLFFSFYSKFVSLFQYLVS